MATVQDYDATPKQKKAIAKLCQILGIRPEVEQDPMTVGCAKALQWNLLCAVRAKDERDKVARWRKKGLGG